jgi:zinc/manganese transport system substrate-binding protein
MKRRCAFLLLVLIALTSQAEPLRVVALHPVLAEMAERVGGDAITVDSLLRPGTDPHQYEPVPSDLRRLIEADVVLAAGLGLEGYLPRLAGRIELQGPLIAVGDLLPRDQLLMPDSDHVHDDHPAHVHAPSDFDPHWWHSVALYREVLAIVSETLRGLRPADAAAFASRTAIYDAELVELGSWCRQRIEAIPLDRRRILTMHNAFAYLARDLGFEIVSLNNFSLQTEPTARRITQVVNLIRQDHIVAVFFESGASPRLAETLRSETQVRLGRTLFADGPGPAGSGAETYATMMRSNVTALVEALRPDDSGGQR